MKIASAPTTDRLTKLLNEYFFSTTYKIVDGKVYNSKGLVENIEIQEKKNRFTAVHK
jgi:hypothetical protein